MSRTPGWAVELARGGDAALVELAVRAAVTPWAGPAAGSRLVERLLIRDGTAPPAREVLHRLLRPERLGEEPATAADVEQAARALLAADARVLVVGEPDYPQALGACWPAAAAPLWLLVRRGSSPSGVTAAPLPEGPAVAVVGTRRATHDGLRTAHALGAFLAERGVCVVSGLARGIDQAGHQGALSVGGPTLAVLGTGFGVDYPRRDGPLRTRVAACGGLVTEYAPGAPPWPRHFLERNRIVAGLTQAVVVVEGQARSGALHTARLAAERGIDVWAVPGSISAPTSQGPLALIRLGAYCVTELADVLASVDTHALPAPADGGVGTRLLGHTPQARPPVTDALADAAPPVTDAPNPAVEPGDARFARLAPDEQRLARLLSVVPVQADALAAATGLAVGEVLSALGTLELAGLLRVTPHGLVSA